MFEERVAELLGKAKEVGLSRQEILERLEKPQNQFGDIAFPCFSLAPKLKKNPSEIARELCEKLGRKKPEEIEKIQALGGYLNFFINKTILAGSVLEKIDKDYGKSNTGSGKKIAIDFSGPNVGKPMHIGHIRSTILGDSLIKIYDFLGYDAVGINYLGDIGLHIGKLIVAYGLWLDRKALKENAVNELLRIYIKFCEKENTEYREGLEEEFQDNEWTSKAKEKLKLLEVGDKETHKMWAEILKHSKKGFAEIYKMLNVNFHEITGQSLFSDVGKGIITNALKKGLAKIEPDGAVYVELENLPKKYVLRSNGTASYITQDIGAAAERYKKYKFDRMIYVADFRQNKHFQQLFAILKKFGYDFSDKLAHASFGTVNFGREIIATRKGKIILLKDVLEKTIEKAEKEIKKRKTKGNAEILGIGAVKYAFLKNEPARDVNFSWEQALNFEGDSGPYLQYAYARASSILRKAFFKKEALGRNKKIKADCSLLKNEKEIELMKLLSEFPNICKSAAEHLAPNLIAGYAYKLAQAFNDFYEACPVLNAEKGEKEARLLLVAAARHVLRNALSLLGIEVLEQM